MRGLNMDRIAEELAMNQSINRNNMVNIELESNEEKIIEQRDAAVDRFINEIFGPTNSRSQRRQEERRRARAREAFIKFFCCEIPTNIFLAALTETAKGAVSGSIGAAILGDNVGEAAGKGALGGAICGSTYGIFSTFNLICKGAEPPIFSLLKLTYLMSLIESLIGEGLFRGMNQSSTSFKTTAGDFLLGGLFTLFLTGLYLYYNEYQKNKNLTPNRNIYQDEPNSAAERDFTYLELKNTNRTINQLLSENKHASPTSSDFDFFSSQQHFFAQDNSQASNNHTSSSKIVEIDDEGNEMTNLSNGDVDSIRSSTVSVATDSADNQSPTFNNINDFSGMPNQTLFAVDSVFNMNASIINDKNQAGSNQRRHSQRGNSGN